MVNSYEEINGDTQRIKDIIDVSFKKKTKIVDENIIARIKAI